ncbi:hypothetical protein [Niabella drilacis]|nr:hypothetical protein [Niabella drilacis]
MKRVFVLLVLTVVAASCGKDKDVPSAKAVFMSKWNWVYGADGSKNGSETYAFDAGHKIVSSIFYNIETTPAGAVNYTYTSNAAGRITKAQHNNGYRTFEYNASGQVLKASFFNASGTLTRYYLYNYTADGYEQVSYAAAGVAGSKKVFQYTADKKNIASRTVYNSAGTKTEETVFTFLTTRSPENIYPYSEMMKIEQGFANQHAVEVASTSVSGTSYTTRHTYTYNAEGYPLTDKETYSTGAAPSNMTYEYILK